MNAPGAAAAQPDGRVSVIIPTYNYGHFVEQAIASVEAQDYPAIDIIVIDDGSTDDTAARLAGRGGITYVRQENLGLSAARNHGLRLARGEFLQFLDADDLLTTDAIRLRVAFLRAHPAVSAVFCRSVFFSAADRLDARPGTLAEWPQPPADEVDLALYFSNIAPPHAFLVRRATVTTHGLSFDPTLRACEDYDFWYRLARASGPPHPLADTRVFYRQHAASMSHAHGNQYRHDAEMCRRIRADIRAGGAWLGQRAASDYLAALYCASLLACRRLWHVERTGLAEFVSGHLLPLQEELATACAGAPPSGAGRRYLCDARLLALRLWQRDGALSRTAWRRLAPPGGASQLAAALTHRGGAPRGLGRLLRADFLYGALRLRGWLGRTVRGADNKTHDPAENPGHDQLA